MKLLLADAILPYRKKYAPVICPRGARYIDPTLGVNGVGTFADPHNAWGVTNWWMPGTAYLQKEMTQYNAEIVVYNNGPYFLGTYDALTGNPIQDKTRHAKVRPASGRALSLGTMDTAGRNNIAVDNLDLRAPRLNISFTEGIANTAAEPDTRINVQVRRCLLDGKYGAQLKGAGLLIEDCEINGFDGALSLQTTDMRIRRNRVIHIVDPGTPFVNYDPEWGGITNTTPDNYAPEDVYIEDNYVHGDGSWKQCVHFMVGVGVPAPTSLGKIVIRGNDFHSYKQPIYCSYSDALIEDNDFNEVFIPPGAPTDPTAWGISIVNNNCTIRGNRMNTSPTARFVNIAASAGTTLIEDNEVRGVREGIIAKSGTHAVIARNNLLTRAALDGALETDAALIWLLSTITPTMSGNRYGWTDGNPQFTTGGIARAFAAYQAAVEPTAQQVAP